MVKSAFVLSIFALVSCRDHFAPELFCEKGTVQNRCNLRNVRLFPNETQYNIRLTSGDNEDITTVEIFGVLPVINPSFCETFPQLYSFIAHNVYTENVHPDAFKACHEIASIKLDENKISSLSPDLFSNNYKLRYLYLYSNRIGCISENQFKNNALLQILSLRGNQIGNFPVSAVENCKELTFISLHSNNLLEIDAEELVSALPNLKDILINGNMLPCSRVMRTLSIFRVAGVVVSMTFSEKNTRPFRMTTVRGFTCVADQ